MKGPLLTSVVLFVLVQQVLSSKYRSSGDEYTGDSVNGLSNIVVDLVASDAYPSAYRTTGLSTNLANSGSVFTGNSRYGGGYAHRHPRRRGGDYGYEYDDSSYGTYDTGYDTDSYGHDGGDDYSQDIVVYVDDKDQGRGHGQRRNRYDDDSYGYNDKKHKTGDWAKNLFRRVQRGGHGRGRGTRIGSYLRNMGRHGKQGYGDDRQSGYGDDRHSGYGDDRHSGYGDDRQSGYGDQRKHDNKHTAHGRFSAKSQVNDQSISVHYYGNSRKLQPIQQPYGYNNNYRH
ncbi:PREDICTED: TATA-binding protein-associated factor 2N-like isoform X2 [Priapulus caudatus]|uniref:TATA-binding protein-associated factor 2N-like isoform X2 n=1 Tax=Priapulus caudatus TaxID=37621 RepID=A0ABM1E718_PRICU|nr:PREDICTED: TATA-binding protein-associated factor 2N-like isoform X2 [Priapulus caudatus]